MGSGQGKEGSMLARSLARVGAMLPGMHCHPKFVIRVPRQG